jgi:hypothetical protein
MIKFFVPMVCAIAFVISIVLRSGFLSWQRHQSCETSVSTHKGAGKKAQVNARAQAGDQFQGVILGIAILSSIQIFSVQKF